MSTTTSVAAEHKPVLIAGVIVAGLFLGVNNTLITEAVMISAPVERSTASAAYSFVRFAGGAGRSVAGWKTRRNQYLATVLGGCGMHRRGRGGAVGRAVRTGSYR